MALSEWADSWDENKKETEKILMDWVIDNPQWWAVGALVQTSMDLGQGMVDVLRFGEGAAEGGWRGYGKDALRLLTLLGPIGRLSGLASRFAHMQMIRLAVKPVGTSAPCTFMAVNNAMNIVSGPGRNLFLTVRDAAKALGRNLSKVPFKDGKYALGAWIDDLVGFLRMHGAKIKQLGNINTIDDVIKAAKAENGVVVFAIKCARTGAKPFQHSVIAFRDGLGRVRFADYGGKFYASLEELIRAKSGWANVETGTMTLMKNVKGAGATVFDGLEFTGLLEEAMAVMKGAVILIEGVTAIETADEGVVLAIPVVVGAVPTSDQEVPPEVVKQAFNAYKARAEGKAVVRMPEMHINGRPVPRADWLTGVQYRLNAAGFGAGRVDGILGPRTTRAIRKFQETYKSQFNLRVDSIPGPETQQALVSLCGY